MMQEMAWGFSLLEEALVGSEAQGPHVEWYMKLAADVQKAIQCYCVIYDKVKKATRHHRRRQWHPTPVFLPGKSQGWGSLVSCRLWGRTDSDRTEAT